MKSRYIRPSLISTTFEGTGAPMARMSSRTGMVEKK